MDEMDEIQWMKSSKKSQGGWSTRLKKEKVNFLRAG
jgi:hypothetical protein